jgi:hypothetical protein
MERFRQTLCTMLAWESARLVSCEKSKLYEVLKPIPPNLRGDIAKRGDYYALDDVLMVPDVAEETVISVEFPPQVDLQDYVGMTGEDCPETTFFLPRLVLDLGRSEFVPYGALVNLAKADLSVLSGLQKFSIEDEIGETPKHERQGKIGYYHLVAYYSVYGDSEDEDING